MSAAHITQTTANNKDHEKKSSRQKCQAAYYYLNMPLESALMLFSAKAAPKLELRK
jgi:hypothetical protein